MNTVLQKALKEPNIEGLSEISVTRASKDLLKVLGNNENELNTSKQDELLVEILKALEEQDKVIGNHGDEEKATILHAVWQYKKICNMNDAESRCANTLKMFVKDIYKDSLHFFLEIIQNADDASKGGQKHELDITVSEDCIVFEYDERGFNYSDLFAITSLGNSTKKAKLQDDADIGEKGIGFKSIFAVVDKVKIESKYFGFSIENKKGELIHILEPSEITLYQNPKTRLTLHLKELFKTEENLNEIKKWMENNIYNPVIDQTNQIANPFLFLKNIESVSYCLLNTSENQSITLIKEDTNNPKFKLIKIGDQRYLKYSEQMAFDKEAILARWNHLETEVKEKQEDYKIYRAAEICFPLNYFEQISKGKIYSYLPTTIEVNFPILLNLDVHLTASRGNISEQDFEKTSEWNKQVEENLGSFLVEAYKEAIEFLNVNADHPEYADLYCGAKESFYLYIPSTEVDASTTSKIYNQALHKFRNEILNEAIFLANDGCFKTKYEVLGISASVWHWKLIYQEKTIQALYDMLAEVESNLEKAYLFSPKWVQFAVQSDAKLEFYNPYDIISCQQGIAHYWADGEVQRKENIRKVISVLCEDASVSIIRDKNNCKKLAIIPVEKDETGFEFMSYEEITNEKALFFHSQTPEIEDVESSVYVYEKEDEAVFNELKNFAEKVFYIAEYNVAEYFSKEVTEIEENITEESVRKLISKTAKFYERNSEDFKRIDNQKKLVISKFLNHYTLNREQWDLYLNSDDKLSTVNDSYIHALTTCQELKIWEVDLDESKLNLINYLIFLGIKHKIDFDFKLNKIDEISLNLLPNKVVMYDKKDRTVQTDSLTTYYLKVINEYAACIDKETLESYCESLNLLKKVGETYQAEGKELLIINSDKIERINSGISQLRENQKKIFELDDSLKCIVSGDDYFNIWSKLDLGKEDIDKLVSSFNKNGKDFILNLRMVKLLNEALNLNYAWGHNGNPRNLSLIEFLSCHKELNGEENLAILMKSGYKVNININFSWSKYFEAENFERLYNFLLEMGIVKNDDLSGLGGTQDTNGNETCIYIVEAQIQEKVISYTDKSDKFNKILVQEQKKKSDTLLLVLSALGKKVTNEQEKLIKDYFNELKEPVVTLSELSTKGMASDCEDIFFDFHTENVKEAMDKLPTIWSKDALEALCKPYELNNGQQVAGYGYDCSICGHTSQAALNGMKLKRFKNGGEIQEIHPYLYIVSCLNCNKMLETAKSIEIMDLAEIMDQFDSYYCSDERHLNNHAIMKTVKLKVKLYNDQILNLSMKMSYLNLVFYKSNTNK